jgi:hypothetical protein
MVFVQVGSRTGRVVLMLDLGSSPSEEVHQHGPKQ